MKKILLIFICLLMTVMASAQTKNITGTVVDADGTPLIGATILEVGGSSNGTTTNFDGEFTIAVQKGATLKVSYLGYEPTTIHVGDKNHYQVSLRDDSQALDEVVVIGYGTQKRSTMTAAVATVSAKEVNKQVVPNVASALQGRAAGVDIVQQGGIAGADVNIVIRGAASLTGTEPLYIVDGVFTNNGLSTVNPADIESIDILKDGAAAAIYGSRAANGVVIITTKSGKKGAVKVAANASFSVQQISHTPKFLNASQWREFSQMVAANSGLSNAPEDVNPTDPSVDTNWAKEWLQFAPVYNADFNVMGGGEIGNYSFSMGFFDQEGLTKKSAFTRYNARFTSSFKKGKFTFSDNISFVFRDRKPTSTFAINLPTLPVKDAQGRYASWGPDYYIETENARRNNPFAGLYARDAYTRYYDVMGGFNASYEFIKGLTFTTSFSGNYSATQGYTHTRVYYAMWYLDGTTDTDDGNNRNRLSESRATNSNFKENNDITFNCEYGKN